MSAQAPWLKPQHQGGSTETMLHTALPSTYFCFAGTCCWHPSHPPRQVSPFCACRANVHSSLSCRELVSTRSTSPLRMICNTVRSTSQHVKLCLSFYFCMESMGSSIDYSRGHMKPPFSVLTRELEPEVAAMKDDSETETGRARECLPKCQYPLTFNP